MLSTPSHGFGRRRRVTDRKSAHLGVTLKSSCAIHIGPRIRALWGLLVVGRFREGHRNATEIDRTCTKFCKQRVELSGTTDPLVARDGRRKRQIWDSPNYISLPAVEKGSAQEVPRAGFQFAGEDSHIYRLPEI